MCFFFVGDYMYENFSKKITNALLKNGCIIEQDKEIYVYSFQVILSTLVSSVFIIIWSILFKQVLNTVVFFIGFYLCRKISGGYHAKNQFTCFIFTQLIFISFLALITFSNILEYKYILIILTIASNIIIYTIAPVDCENKPFSKEEVLKYKKQSKIFAIFNMIFIIITIHFSIFNNKLFCYIMGVSTISMLLILGKLKKKGGTTNEKIQ